MNESSPPRRRSHHGQPWQATSALAYVGAPPEADDPLLQFEPFIHPRPKRTSITPDLQRRFVATLAATGIVAQAARSIGKSLEALYMLRRRPGAEGFGAAWDEAARWGMDRLSTARSNGRSHPPIIRGSRAGRALEATRC